MRLVHALLLGCALGLLAVGCDDVRKSQLDQSCNITAECAKPLVCVQEVCVMEGELPGRLAGQGESCASSRDCNDGLVCLESTCRAVEVQRVGGLGENCRARNDCAEGYACINGACRQENAPVEPQAKQCEFVQCKNNADCCAPLSDSCQMLRDECEGGDELSCDNFFAICECESICQEERCISVQACRNADDCSGDDTCMDGVCRACETDDDCEGEDRVCENDRCIRACRNNDECGALRDCENARCVDRGCKNDRECIFLFAQNAATAQVAQLAECDEETTQCVLGCDTDVECIAAIGPLMACGDAGYCVNVGCMNDEQCRVLGGSEDDLSAPYESWVCR